MKKTVVSCMILMMLLSGCGKDMTNKGPVPVRNDGGEVRSGDSRSADTKSQGSTVKASEAYPDTLPADAVWTEWPGGNLFGLTGMTANIEGETTTTILAFEYLEDGEVKDRIFRDPKYLDGSSPYGSFQFDDNEVIEEDDCYFVKLSYDSRIELTLLTFSNGDERCIINLRDGVDLTYCDFRDIEKSKRIRQSFDPDSGTWGNMSMEIEDETPRVDIGYTSYTELAIDEMTRESVSEKDGTIFTAMDYKYVQGSYNVYGEIEREPDTSLRFFLMNENGMPDERDHFALYQKTGSGYTDITPSDCTISTETFNNDPRLWVDMHSSLLGELSEGEYRAEYGEYTVDFSLSMQYFEVW